MSWSESIHSTFTYNVLGDALCRLKDYDGAVSARLQADASCKEAGKPGWWNDRVINLAFLGMCYQKLGKTEEARGCVRELEVTPPAWGGVDAPLRLGVAGIIGISSKRPTTSTLHDNR